MDREAKKYEIAYLVAPEVAEDDVARVAGTITRIIEETHGVVGHVSEPKKRLLFYPIRKTRNASFGYTTFTAGSSAPEAITKKLRFEKEILRSLITEEIRAPVKTSGPRAVWQPTEGMTPLHKRTPRREEVPAVSAEERAATIENIDKKLQEILGA